MLGVFVIFLLEQLLRLHSTVPVVEFLLTGGLTRHIDYLMDALAVLLMLVHMLPINIRTDPLRCGLLLAELL